MRKQHSQAPNKQNKYDQSTNLAIDLQSQVNRSVIFPKITSRIIDNELKSYVNRRKHQEDYLISNLKGEVDKLRKEMSQLEDKQYMAYRIKTQSPQHYDCTQHHFRGNLCSHHINHQCMANSLCCHRNTCNNYQLYSKRDSMPMYYEGQNGSLQKMKKSKLFSKQSQQSSFTITDKQKSHKKKRKRQPNLSALRKFRVYALAVYFSIFLPSLARKIYGNKLKLFTTAYPHEVGKYYLGKKEMTSKFKHDQSQLWGFMEERLNIMEEIETAGLTTAIKNASDVGRVKMHLHFLLNQENDQGEGGKYKTFHEQMLLPNNTEFLLTNLLTIVTKLLKEFSSLIQDETFFSQTWKTFSQGLLNNTFINNSHPKLLTRVIQSGIVRLHPFKELVEVYDQPSEIVLLTFDVFCRIYCYRWLSKLHREKSTQKYAEQDIYVGSFLLTVFYLVGEMLIEDIVRTYSKEGMPFDEKQKLRNKKIRPVPPMLIDRKYKKAQTDIKRLIVDPPFFEEIRTIVLQNKEIILQLKTKMIQTGSQLYQKLREEMKTQAITIKQNSLQEKYIIHGDRGRPQNLQKYELNDPTPIVNQSKVIIQASQQKIEPGIKTKMAIKRMKSKNI